MFRCAVTGQVSKPGEAMFKVVIETRPVTYTNWVWDDAKREHVEVTSRGWEIVRELQCSEPGKVQLEEAHHATA